MAPKRTLDASVEPIVRSSSMRSVMRVLGIVARKDIAVTLVGESGAGKEVLAHRVHELSHRRAGPFVPINCAAIPESLFESELFGHEKGAFTGATELAHGKIEAAAGGTLFLDEIAEMPLSVQAKLLRFLEGRKFMRVGGTEKITLDVRLVTATLRPLEEEVKSGRFRADLFYRIQGITLRVPSLRERGGDILTLADTFMKEAARKFDVVPARLTRAAKRALLAHEWPGNARELKNVIETLAILREGKQARLIDLPEGIQGSVTSASPRNPSRRSVLEIRLDRSLDESIDRIISAALELEGGNQTLAARRLSIGLRTIQRHVARSGPRQE